MMTRSLIALAAAITLVACSEKPQSSTVRKVDDKPWAGASTPYAAAGWQGGDQAAWERQLKSRANGQNEYSRTATR